MAKKKTKQNPKQEIINAAKAMGINEIIRNHRRFIRSGPYINEHINNNYLNQMFDSLYNRAQSQRIPQDKIGEYIAKGLASYIVSGKALDNHGKTRILEKGLEKKASSGFFRGRGARKELAGDKYLDQVIGAWTEINEVSKAVGHDLPEEIARPMSYLDYLGFAIPAAELLGEGGLVDRKTYAEIKKNIRSGAYQSHSEALQRFKEASMYQRAAAFIIGSIGVILLIVSGLNLTGGVIGTDVGKNLFLSFIGTISFLSSLVLFVKKPKRIFKK